MSLDVWMLGLGLLFLVVSLLYEKSLERLP
jgi:hypothetical protein